LNTATINHTSLTLAGAELHLWSGTLDADPAHESILTPDELARAQRYRLPLVRQRFIAGRAILRTILAPYLDIEPGDIVFHYSQHGKPSLVDSRLRFNVSHSDNLLLIAVSWHHDLGVDVEYIRPMPDAATIAADYFSRAEYEQFSRLPDDQKPQAFFNCWTRKEAYIKACGAGFAIPFSSFEVSFLPGEPAQMIHPAAQDSRSWHMHAFSPDQGAVAAVVAALG
jgi:4'-phosphopantetheinyl transferase